MSPAVVRQDGPPRPGGTCRLDSGSEDVRATISELLHDYTPRGTHFCTCGHLLGEHDPDSRPACDCGCPAYTFSGDVLRECGHLPDDDPCDRISLPVVQVKRTEDDRWVIDCPYCGREHQHGAAPGDRVSHCHQGDYVIKPPVRKRAKLPFRKVWDRDNWTCIRCGTHKDLTVDHIIPISKGGTDDLENLQTMCGSCNSSKGNRT